MHLRVGELSCLSRFRFPCPHPFRSLSSTMSLLPRSLHRFLSFIVFPLHLHRFLCLQFDSRSPYVMAHIFPGSSAPPCSTLIHTALNYVHACRCLGDRSPSFLFFGSWSDDRLCVLGIDASHSGCDLGRKAFNLFAAQ